MRETKINFLDEIDLKHKNVFMRVDFNVPIKDGRVIDAYRIHKALPSIRYILKEGGRLVLGSHLGRPTKNKRDAFSLKPVAEYLTEELGFEILFIEQPDSEAPKALLNGLKGNQIILLENLRFHEGEMNKDKRFAEKLASYTNVYINEGFSISHREHSSITLLPELIPERGIGFHFQEEMAELDRIRFHSESPFFVIIGGSKISDKISILNSLADRADEFFIGGMIAYTFLKAKGISVGDSPVESDCLNIASDFMHRLKVRGKTLWLPEDHIVVKKIQKPYEIQTTKGNSVPAGYKAVDIGPRTQKIFCKEIKRSKSLLWNGPLGLFELDEFSKGTSVFAKHAGNHEKAYRVVGGGHSALAVREYEDSINYVSTGGGASLHYLQGTSVPGIESIRVPEAPIDERVYDEDGYDQHGYNEDGYDAEGYDANGCDENGYFE